MSGECREWWRSQLLLLITDLEHLGLMAAARPKSFAFFRLNEAVKCTWWCPFSLKEAGPFSVVIIKLWEMLGSTNKTLDQASKIEFSITTTFSRRFSGELNLMNDGRCWLVKWQTKSYIFVMWRDVKWKWTHAHTVGEDYISVISLVAHPWKCNQCFGVNLK